MPRATRYLENGYLYHLTHRCANGEFFNETLAGEPMRRESHWTEAVAVGDRKFIAATGKDVKRRQKLHRYGVETPSKETVWAVRETEIPYSRDSTEIKGL